MLFHLPIDSCSYLASVRPPARSEQWKLWMYLQSSQAKVRRPFRLAFKIIQCEFYFILSYQSTVAAILRLCGNLRVLSSGSRGRACRALWRRWNAGARWNSSSSSRSRLNRWSCIVWCGIIWSCTLLWCCGIVLGCRCIFLCGGIFLCWCRVLWCCFSILLLCCGRVFLLCCGGVFLLRCGRVFLLSCCCILRRSFSGCCLLLCSCFWQ